MDFRLAAAIPHPVGEVYRLYRDDLDRLSRGAGHIERIELSDVRRAEGVTSMRHRWFVRVPIPPRARSWVPPDKLRWDADVLWVDAEVGCTFVIHPPILADRVRCAGRVMLREQDGVTTVVMSGAVTVDLTGIAALPGPMGRGLGARVERFVVERLPPSFEAVAARVAAEIASTGARGPRSRPR